MAAFKRCAVLGVGLCVLVALSGCASSGTPAGVKQAGKTAENMDKFVESLDEATAQIDQTIASMNAIEPAPDRVAALKTFNKDVATLESMADKARKRANAMRQRGDDYFATWTEQSAAFNNPELRALSEQRRQELQASFDEMRTLATEAKGHFETMMQNIYDIQLFLGNDLTPAALDAVSKYMEAATEESKGVNEALSAMIKEVGKVREMLSPGSGAPPADAAAPAEGAAAKPAS